MTKNEIFQFVNKLNAIDIPTMLYRETVFDIISFGKSSKIHLAATASIERLKRTLTEYSLEDVADEKDTIKFAVGGDTIFIHSIFKISYEDFVEKMVATNLTFNSLLMKPNGQIFDMYGGLSDLKEKRLVFVENFNQEPQNHLTLNCIRYIYKNNFSFDEQVGQYIARALPTFSKNEKTNALYYLAEFLLQNHNDTRLKLVLNNDFCKSDKYQDVEVGKYEEVIERVGVIHFIYLLLLLLGVNVNKSRFSNLLNTEEFNDVKKSFSLNLNDEITYYALKEEKGYEYLSTIVTLQKEFALLTKANYTEPIYHQKTIFDVLECNNSCSTVNDEYLLEEQEPIEKISLPHSDAFDFTNNLSGDSSANVEVVDFSHLFDDDTTAIDNDGEETEAIDESEDSVKTAKENEETKVSVDSEVATTAPQENNDKEISYAQKAVSCTDEFEEKINIPENNSCAKKDEPHDEVIASDGEELVSDEFNKMLDMESDSTIEDVSNFQSIDEEDDIAALLNADNEEKDVFIGKKRSVNPNFNRQNKKTEEDNIHKDETSNNINNATNDIPTEVVKPSETEVAVTELDFSQMFASSTPEQQTTDVPASQSAPHQQEFAYTPTGVTTSQETNSVVANEEIEPPMSFTFEVPVEATTAPAFAPDNAEQESKQPPLTQKENLINSIFEEEVKTPEVVLSPDFASVMKQVETESKTIPQDTVTQRNTVTETLMTETVPEKPKVQQSSEFEISEKDLEAILEELNGRKKNSFIDDDETPNSDGEDEFNISSIQSYTTPSQPAYQYNPNPTPAKSDDSDDFFKALNDDFAEIVGGNQ